MNTLDLALAFTLPAEGGYVNDPLDHGGATNKGITQYTYDTYRDSKKLPRRTVELLTSAETADIYTEMYWHPGHCEGMSPRLAVVHFDWCVNHGVLGAIKTLQQALVVEADGMPGPHTFMAVQECDPLATSKTYNSIRRGWYRDRVQQRPDQAQFLDGWLKRVDRLDKYVESL